MGACEVVRRRIFSVTRTPDEWSIVCEQALLPHDDSSSVDSPLKVERDWRAFKVRGPLDFQLTGILASLAAPLSQAPAGGIAISLFAISTFDTDYILVKSARFEDAITTWTTAGHEIHRSTQL